MGFKIAANAALREVYSNAILPQETRKTSDRQPNLAPKQLAKEQEKKKLVEGKKNHKDQSRNK